MTLRDIGEEIINLYDNNDLIDVVDLIELAKKLMNWAGFTFDSYRRLTPEEK